MSFYEHLGKGIDRIDVMISRIRDDLNPEHANVENTELIMSELRFIARLSQDLIECIGDDLSDRYDD